MAFFKFRKGGDDQPTPSVAPESVEAMRKRAKHRLIGAAVLVLMGVIGFPLIFDSQPRPISVDIPIDIPDKAKVKPLGNLPLPVSPQGSAGTVDGVAPVASNAASTASTPKVEPKPEPKPVAKSEPKEEIIAPSKPVAKPEPKPEAKVESKPAAKPVEAKVPDAKPDAKAAEAAKAKALLEGQSPDTKQPAVEGRFVVQVGAYTEVPKAREVRMKLEKAGFKTYTQVIEGKEGKRIRVRIGPFATRADAVKATDKIKKLDLPAAILEL